MTRLKVSDLEAETFQIIQSTSDIKQFNAEYGEDFAYYFIEWRDETRKLYGADHLLLDSRAYFVTDI